MAEKIPLNFYKRVTKSLLRVPTTLYTTPPGRASILLNTFTNNNSNSNNYVTISLSSTSQDDLTYLNRFPLTKKDVINLTPQKVITTEGDSFNASADIEDITNLNDPALFWEFNLPTNITTLDNITFAFTSGSQISADFGTGGIPNKQRALNADFSDWTGWPESSPGSNTTTEYPVSSGGIVPQGPAGWVLSLNANSIDSISGLSATTASGTFSIKKQTSTPEDSLSINNIFYPRIQLTNIDSRLTTPLNTSITVPQSSIRYYGAGLLLRSSTGESGNISTNPIVINLGNDLFGTKIKVSAKMRASENTKVAVEVPVTLAGSADPTTLYNGTQPTYGTQGNYTIFNVTTAWETHEAVFTYPTFEQFWANAYDQLSANDDNGLANRTGGILNWSYTSVDPSIASIVPLSAYTFGLSYRFYYSYRNTYRRITGTNNTDVANLINTVNAALITNGYYDIAGLEVFVESGTDFVRLSSFQPVDFTYDLSNETDTNITLSILETDNRPA